MSDDPKSLSSFARQRLVFMALLGGPSIYAILVAVLLMQSAGKGLASEPIPMLDTAVIPVGGVFAFNALLVRAALRRRAKKLAGPARSAASFVATLVPLALLEGGSIFCATVWLLNGSAVPGLVMALVLLALAIVIVPFTDPDAKG